MTISIRQNKVAAVLLPSGWHTATVGTFVIDRLELKPDPGTGAEAEDWGFSFKEAGGIEVAGRLSELIAVRETA